MHQNNTKNLVVIRSLPFYGPSVSAYSTRCQTVAILRRKDESNPALYNKQYRVTPHRPHGTLKTHKNTRMKKISHKMKTIQRRTCHFDE